MKLFVLNRKTVYCSIIFANHVESTKVIKIFVNEIKSENIFTATEATFLPNTPRQN
jgi:hypothetical protein